MAEELNTGQALQDPVTPLCDPTTLAWTENAHHPYTGVRADIVATQAAIWNWDALMLPIVIAIASLSAAPWIWRKARAQAVKLKKRRPVGIDGRP